MQIAEVIIDQNEHKKLIPQFQEALSKPTMDDFFFLVVNTLNDMATSSPKIVLRLGYLHKTLNSLMHNIVADRPYNNDNAKRIINQLHTIFATSHALDGEMAASEFIKEALTLIVPQPSGLKAEYTFSK